MRVCVLFVLALVASCASKPRAPSEAAAPPARIKDSAPEKRAALRSADPNLGADADEQRWGFEAARERKRQADEKNRANAAPAVPGPPAPLPTGPFDIRAKSQSPTGAQP